MVNLSLISGIFPDIFKTSHVIPPLKKPSLPKDDMKNYRPVLNVNFVSNIIEQVDSKFFHKKRSINSVSVNIQEVSLYWNYLTENWKWQYFECGRGKCHCTYSVRSVCCFRHSEPQKYHQSPVNLVWYRWYRPWLVCVLLVRSSKEGETNGLFIQSSRSCVWGSPKIRPRPIVIYSLHYPP